MLLCLILSIAFTTTTDLGSHFCLQVNTTVKGTCMPPQYANILKADLRHFVHSCPHSVYLRYINNIITWNYGNEALGKFQEKLT